MHVDILTIGLLQILKQLVLFFGGGGVGGVFAFIIVPVDSDVFGELGPRCPKINAPLTIIMAE